MNQRWWIAIVAVVGIGLAVLLFPRPDTGDGISGSQPGGAVAVGEEGGATVSGGTTSVGKPPRPPINPDRIRTGVKPGTEGRAAQRNRPEAVYASKLITPLSAMRYTLMKEGSEPAKALAEEIGTLMNEDLRKIRLDPDAVPWPALETRMDETVAHVQASPFASDETITKSLSRYKEFIAEYHQAKSTEGTAPADIPAGAPAGTPPAVPVEE